MQSRKSCRLLAYSAFLAISASLAGCGGGDGTGQPPIAAAPTPTPTPTPTPVPTPTPSPTPASTADPKFASARIGEQVLGPAVCAVADVTHDASGAVTGLGSIKAVNSDLLLAITYEAKDTYTLELNGFSGFSFKPANRLSFPSPVYARYADPVPAEMLLSQYSLGSVVFGTYADTSHCFFAAGLTARSLPTIAVNYYGVVDGLAVIDGKQSRVFSEAFGNAVMDFDFARGSGSLSLKLLQRADPFGNFEASPPVELGTVTANLTIVPGRTSLAAPLSGAGYTGTVRGLFVDNGNTVLGKDVGGAGVALVYELRSPSGDLIYGTVAFAANLI